MLSPTPESMLDARTASASQLRLLRCQLDEIACLVEGQAHCPDVLNKMYAVQTMLHTIQRRLIQHHLQVSLLRLTLVPVEAASQEILAEVRELYSVRHCHASAAPMTRDRAVERGYL
jgi:DNA-binding FrmR family transcriptional regulator